MVLGSIREGSRWCDAHARHGSSYIGPDIVHRGRCPRRSWVSSGTWDFGKGAVLEWCDGVRGTCQCQWHARHFSVDREREWGPRAAAGVRRGVGASVWGRQWRRGGGVNHVTHPRPLWQWRGLGFSEWLGTPRRPRHGDHGRARRGIAIKRGEGGWRLSTGERERAGEGAGARERAGAHDSVRG